MGKNAPRTSYFLLSVLVLIVIAFAVSYYRYMVTLDYDLFLTGSCDPSSEVCVVYEEEYYSKYLVSAQSISTHCVALEPDACVEELVAKELAELQDCEEFLDEGEACSSPEDFAEGEGTSDTVESDGGEPAE